MKVGPIEFSPGFWPTLVFICLLPVFVALGFWQMQRAAEKSTILDELEKKAAEPATLIEKTDETHDVFKPVVLHGRFDKKRQFLLDNRIFEGAAGYEILTPFRLDSNGRLVLVNRGWIAIGSSRESLPEITLSGELPTEVSGLYTRPSRGYQIGPALQDGDDLWPKRLQFVDYDLIANELDGDVVPGIVQIKDNIGGDFPKIWQPVAFGPEKHYAYALQWFAIAFVLLVIYIALNSKKVT